MIHRCSIFVLFVALQAINAFAQDHLPIPEGRLGFPLGTYVEIEGVRADKGKVGVNTLLVDRINEKRLQEPIGVWIENVDALPKEKKIILRGYESGKMIGLPDEVAQKENLPIPAAAWQFYRYFVVTRVIQPETLKQK